MPTDQTSDLFPFFDLISDISQEWNEAEAAIKRCEQIAGEVSQPAISELRYGGRRVIDALEKAHENAERREVEALLEDARFCCHRARHDAVDASFSKIAIDLDNLTAKLGFEAIIDAYPDFRDFFRQFQVSRKRIVESRRERKKRHEIYEYLASTDLQKVSEQYEELMASRPIAKSYKRKQFLGGLNGIAILLLGILTAVFAGLAVDWENYGFGSEEAEAATSSGAT